MEVVIAAG